MPLNFGRTFRSGAVARSINQRVVYFSMLALALGLLVMSGVEERAAENLRMGVVDTLAPVISALSQPVQATRNMSAAISHYFNVAAKNTQLSADVERLRKWQDVARLLETENIQLRALLAVKADATAYLITGRLIADASGPFLRSGLINVGADDGVRAGMAVTNEYGFIGHIVATGAGTSRVLFLDDLNSRVPVIVEPGGLKGIVAGNNSDYPTIEFVNEGAVLTPGVLIVTSGHGGLFPAGLPVGHVRASEDGRTTITPHVKRAQASFVAVHDFRATGPIGDAVEAPPGVGVPIANSGAPGGAS